MSKFVNRKNRKERTKDEILELIKDGKTDDVIDEYIFRFGADYMIRENNQMFQDWFGEKYDKSHYSLIKTRLLK